MYKILAPYDASIVALGHLGIYNSPRPNATAPHHPLAPVKCQYWRPHVRIYGTHPQCSWSAELCLQAIREGSRRTWFVRVCEVHNSAHASAYSDGTANQEKGFSGSEMRIFLGREHTQNVVVFVYWLPKVPPLLLVPPVAVRISKLPLYWRRVDVAAVLYRSEYVQLRCFIVDKPYLDLQCQLEWHNISL